MSLVLHIKTQNKLLASFNVTVRIFFMIHTHNFALLIKFQSSPPRSISPSIASASLRPFVFLIRLFSRSLFFLLQRLGRSVHPVSLARAHQMHSSSRSLAQFLIHAASLLTHHGSSPPLLFPLYISRCLPCTEKQ